MLYQFHELANKKISALIKHFENIGLDVSLLVLEWFLTAFAKMFGAREILLIYDSILLKNNCNVMVLLAVALMVVKERELMTCLKKVEVFDLFEKVKLEKIDLSELLFNL